MFAMCFISGDGKVHFITEWPYWCPTYISRDIEAHRRPIRMLKCQRTNLVLVFGTCDAKACFDTDSRSTVMPKKRPPGCSNVKGKVCFWLLGFFGAKIRPLFETDFVRVGFVIRSRTQQLPPKPEQNKQEVVLG